MEAEKQRSSTDAEPMEAQKQRSSTDAMSSDKALEQIKAAGAKSQEHLVKASSPLGHKPAMKKEQVQVAEEWMEGDERRRRERVLLELLDARDHVLKEERVGLHDKADDADHDAHPEEEDTTMIQKVKEKVKDTAKASLEEVMETAFSNFTMELQTAKEEMESLVGDSGSAHQQRPSMDDIERYMKMKNSVFKKAQAELNAGEMVGKDALCTNCYPFEEWLNVEGVPKAQHLPAVRHPHVPDQVPRPGAVLLPAHHPRSMSRPAVVLQVHLPAQQPTVHRPRQAVQAGLRPAQQASGRRPLQAAMHMPQVLRVSHLLPDGRIRLHVPPLHICLLPGLPGLLLRGRGAPPGKRPHLPTCQRADG